MISLYQAPMSSCAQKVRFVLEEKGLDWEKIPVDLNGGENLKPEFLKLNPKGVIPVLIDDGDVFLESNNICIYLDEKYPDTPLMPDTPKGRSDVRTLMQHIDEHVHNDISACTYTLVFRARLLKKHDTPEALANYLDSIPDAGKREFRRQILTKGVQSIEFEVGVTRCAAMVARLNERLQSSSYLAGDQLTLADIAYAPYITRLDHLSMSYLWQDKPAIVGWYERIKTANGYETGMRAYFDDQVIARMNAAGVDAADEIRAILA